MKKRYIKNNKVNPRTLLLSFTLAVIIMNILVICSNRKTKKGETSLVLSGSVDTIGEKDFTIYCLKHGKNFEVSIPFHLLYKSGIDIRKDDLPMYSFKVRTRKKAGHWIALEILECEKIDFLSERSCSRQ